MYEDKHKRSRQGVGFFLFIHNKENHLPNVPSEKELEKKDISVAEMSAVMLRKIEELTLYAVEQNKQIETLKKEVEFLKYKK